MRNTFSGMVPKYEQIIYPENMGLKLKYLVMPMTILMIWSVEKDVRGEEIVWGFTIPYKGLLKLIAH